MLLLGAPLGAPPPPRPLLRLQRAAAVFLTISARLEIVSVSATSSVPAAPSQYKLFMTVVLSPRVDRVKNDLKLSLTLRIFSVFEQIDME